jgi:phosphoribosylamine--glycine ligase
MLACVEGRLAEHDLKWSADAAICVVAASGGYPGKYEKGKVIAGLENFPVNGEAMVFQAGTAADGKGNVVTAGGRVLGLMVRDTYFKVAVERAYELMRQIQFDGMHYRSDIGRKALDRLK